MRRFALLVVLVSNVAPALALEQEKILKALQSVVMIRGYNASGGLSYGSGVVVAKNTVITNCHIFRSTKEPWVALSLIHIFGFCRAFCFTLWN